MKVLIADDDPTACTVLKSLVNSWGFDTCVVHDGQSALDLLIAEEDPPRLVLLDWEMPTLDGFAVCERLRAVETCDPAYIILITSHDQTDRIATALQAGANDFIAKPTQPVELRARMSVGMRTLELQTKLNRANEMLAYRAEHDELTQLRNRTAALERLEHELTRVQRKGGCLAIALCDIDEFKKINDQYGHPIGDQVLVQFAERLGDVFDPYDVIGRYGGEEFIVVAEVEHSDQAPQKFETLRGAIFDRPFQVGNLCLNVSVSIGVTHYSCEATRSGQANGKLISDLISQADQALYLAKGSGRNCVRLAQQLTH